MVVACLGNTEARCRNTFIRGPPGVQVEDGNGVDIEKVPLQAEAGAA